VTTVVFTNTLTAIVIAVTGAVLGSLHRLGFAASGKSSCSWPMAPGAPSRVASSPGAQSMRCPSCRYWRRF
jgi:hypothetical protein